MCLEAWSICCKQPHIRFKILFKVISFLGIHSNWLGNYFENMLSTVVKLLSAFCVSYSVSTLWSLVHGLPEQIQYCIRLYCSIFARSFFVGPSVGWWWMVYGGCITKKLLWNNLQDPKNDLVLLLHVVVDVGFSLPRVWVQQPSIHDMKTFHFWGSCLFSIRAALFFG